MESKDLTIETVHVEIKVIRVGGHKMTISVFQQIEASPLWQLLAYRYDLEMERESES
jgi:hypothetical protein